MASINIARPKEDQGEDQENEEARLGEMNVVEYYNNGDKGKRTIYPIFIYRIIIAFFITLLIFLLLYLIIKTSFNIIYNEQTNLNNRNIDNNIKAESQIKENIIIGEKSNTFRKKYDPGKKIGLAFVYDTLFSNGISRFITVTADYLMKTGKYDICFITGKPYYKEYTFNSSIKRFIAINNYTLIRNISKNENIDIFILQNVLSPQIINFYKSIGKKVIGIFHGVFMSPLSHNGILSYRNWHDFDLYDSYVFIAADDYYFYKKLGFQNEIFIPNLYTFQPWEKKNSNLTYNNIMMLGRLNDPIKGGIYAIKAMYYVVKQIPDARLHLVTSDYRIEFIKNLTKELNLTKNVDFTIHTYNISECFWNSSVYWFTSLSEAFPMALNEGKAHGVPIVAFDVPYSPPYQDGVITVDLLDVEALARETVNLLKDYDYRKRMGIFAKKSLDKFSNKETVDIWNRLFHVLLSDDRNDYRKMQEDIENKYYNEEIAKIHMEKHFKALLRYNNNFSCHTLENFTNLDYIKNIKICNNIK